MDVSTHLTTLKRRPGISSWRPAVNRDVDMSFASYKDYCDSLRPYPPPDRLSVATLEENEVATNREENDGKRVGMEGRKGRGKNPNGSDGAQEGGSDVRNRMLETHWPPANSSELGLEHWSVRCRAYFRFRDKF